MRLGYRGKAIISPAYGKYSFLPAYSKPAEVNTLRESTLRLSRYHLNKILLFTLLFEVSVGNEPDNQTNYVKHDFNNNRSNHQSYLNRVTIVRFNSQKLQEHYNNDASEEE